MLIALQPIPLLQSLLCMFFIFLWRENNNKQTDPRRRSLECERDDLDMWLFPWVLSFSGWRREFNHCILLSLKQFRTDILLKDEICLGRVIRSCAGAKPLSASLEHIVYHQMIDTHIWRWYGAILLNSTQHPPLRLTQWVRAELCLLISLCLWCSAISNVRFVTLTLSVESGVGSNPWWRRESLCCHTQGGRGNVCRVLGFPIHCWICNHF